MKKNNRFLNAGYVAIDGAFSRLLPTRPHILIACMPKSASTFLASAISELPGFRRYRLTPDWGAREQELCSIRLSRYNRRKYVSQHHLRNSEWTQHLITQYNLTPIVLVRNLADCAISIREHFQKEPGEGPTAYFDKSHLAMSNSEFEEAIVRLAIPWYINFYAGWKAAENISIYDFDEYTAEPEKVMGEILAKATTHLPASEIQQALGRVREQQTRFNVGASGRGELLSNPAKKALLRMMDFYPSLQDDPLFVKTRNTLG